MRRTIVGKVICLVLIVVMISSAFVPSFASGRETSSESTPEIAIDPLIPVHGMVTGSMQNDSGYSWVNRNPSNPPSARNAHALAYDSQSGKVILFGGANGSVVLNDTWAYDYNTNLWTNLNPSNPPPARSYPCLVYDNLAKKVILFGGIGSGGTHYNDTWTYDYITNAWTNRTPGNPPPAREAPAMVFDSYNGKAILFGGWIGGSYFNDTWAYDYAGNTWTNRNPSNPPQARDLHGLAYDNQNRKTILYGGHKGPSQELSDTWAYDYTANSWVNRNPANPPPARNGHAIVYNSQANQVVLFGGKDVGSQRYSDTWKYSYSANSWIQESTSAKPSGRCYFALALLGGSNGMLLFGGAGASDISLNDTWILTSSGVSTQYNQALFSGWNMVTVGLQTPQSPAQLFGSNFQAIYRWDPTAGSYFTPQALEPGLGYWVKMAAATTITVQGTPLVSRTLPLSTGWNQVGSPFASITPWSTVKVVKDATEYTAAAAESAGWIIPAYSWNGTSYDAMDYESSSMGVGQGFWLKANSTGMSLLFGRAGESVTEPITAAQGGTVELSDGAKVVIPPGALSQNTNVTITSLSSVPPCPLATAPSGGYSLDLGGAAALQPIPVTLPVPQSAGSPVIGRWDGMQWVYLPSDDVNPGFLTTTTTHFSEWAVLFGQNPAPTIRWNGEDRFLLGLNYPWHSYGNDFGDNTWGPNISTPTATAVVGNDLATIAGKGVKVLRWWVFCDGRFGINFDQNGTPTGLKADVIADLETAVRLAKEKDLYLVLSLFDYKLCETPSNVNGVKLGGHSDLISNTTKSSTLLSNVIIPLLQKFGREPRILAWEVMNEPEYIISDLPFPEVIQDPIVVPVTMAEFWNFASQITGAIHQNTSAYATIGLAKLKWCLPIVGFIQPLPLGIWTNASAYIMNLPPLNLDFYEVHYYPQFPAVYSPFLLPCWTLGLDRPIVVGEYPATPTPNATTEDNDAATRLDKLLSNGYAGAWPWSYTANTADYPADWTSYSVWSESHVGSVAIPDPSPSGLIATAASSNQINLQWTNHALSADGIEIERKIGAGGTWTTTYTVGASATSYSNTGLTASTTYTYRVRVFRNARTWGSTWNSPYYYSNEASATTKAENMKPQVETQGATLVHAQEAILQGRVNPNGQATLYWFEWGTTHYLEKGATTKTDAGNGTSWKNVNWNLIGLTAGKTYFFRLVAENASGKGYGQILSFTTSTP